MEEFLRLVNKTKKKYKDLLDVDFESEKGSQRIEFVTESEEKKNTDRNLRSSIKKVELDTNNKYKYWLGRNITL